MKEYICSGCKLSTLSNFELSNKPHLECPAGYGEWQEYKDVDYSVYTVTLNISPDCSPETLQALGEMMKILIQQVEKGSISMSRPTTHAADLGYCDCPTDKRAYFNGICSNCGRLRPSG